MTGFNTGSVAWAWESSVVLLVGSMSLIHTELKLIKELSYEGFAKV